MIICSLLFLAILFFCPGAAAAGSKYGVTLWLTELLPTLLPFFICIQLFQQSLPRAASRRGALLLGVLCGYPTGAALVAYQYRRGLLPKHQAYFFLGFANNPSPMFILSFCGAYVLGLSYSDSLCLFGAAILANLIGSLLFSAAYKKCSSPSPTPPAPPVPAVIRGASASRCIDDCILQSFVLITKIGGYVVLFSILGQMLGQFLPLDSSSGILALGTLELTSGISYLKQAALSHTTKEVLTAILICFGGLSAAAQTNSVLSQSGLSIFPYIMSKLLNAFLAGAIVRLLLCVLP